MKKLLLSFIATILLLPLYPGQLQASTVNSTPATSAPVPPEVTVLLARLDEIKSMDIAVMGKAEKKELRKEVRAIRSELKSSSQGVYLSVGAIIIIALLIILLL